MGTTFTRLQDPNPQTNAVVQDIYNKLAAVLFAVQQLQNKGATPATSATTTAASQSGLNLPALTAVPSPNAASATEGNVIEFTPSPSKSGTLYRFTAAAGGYAWAGPLLGGILTDTHANRTNYAPAAYKGTLFRESDRTIIYFSDGTNWLYLAGAMVDVIANRPTPTSHDVGFQFIASDTLQLSYWDGAAWHNVA